MYFWFNLSASTSEKLYIRFHEFRLKPMGAKSDSIKMEFLLSGTNAKSIRQYQNYNINIINLDFLLNTFYLFILN